MRTPLVPAFCILLASLCYVALGAGLGRRAPAPAPTAVATVDVVRVIENLHEFRDRKNEFNARIEAHKKSLAELQERAKQIETELRTTIDPRDIKRHAEKVGELSELNVTIRARDEIFTRRIEVEQGEVLNGLYGKVLATVGALAKKEGYDLVIRDDRGTMTKTGATFNENVARIDARTVLWAADHLAITDRVVTVMNNDYAAGQAPSP